MNDAVFDETKDHVSITQKELLAMFVSAGVIGFIVTVALQVRQRSEIVDVPAGLFLFFICALAAFALIMLRTAFQKRIAFRLGYLTSYTIHKYALPVSLFTTVFFNGWVPFVSPGELKVRESKRLRLGAHRYGLNYGDLTIIGATAPLVCMIVMIFIKPFYLITESYYLHSIIVTTAVIAISGLIPINGTEGFAILYFRRWIWVVLTVFVVSYFLLALATHVFSYLIALLLAGIVYWIYTVYLDQDRN